MSQPLPTLLRVIARRMPDEAKFVGSTLELRQTLLGIRTSSTASGRSRRARKEGDSSRRRIGDLRAGGHVWPSMAKPRRIRCAAQRSFGALIRAPGECAESICHTWRKLTPCGFPQAGFRIVPASGTACVDGYRAIELPGPCCRDARAEFVRRGRVPGLPDARWNSPPNRRWQLDCLVPILICRLVLACLRQSFR